MEDHVGLLLVLIGTFAFTHSVQAQNKQGFINLDCGLTLDESPYTENSTGLTYTSDANFIQSGKSGRIRKDLETNFLKPYFYLRYFPDGIRNCYNLNVMRGTNYLIKATFVYGNYDGLNIYPSFDLHLGPNKWEKVDLKGRANGTIEEIIHIPTSNSLQVCLVKTGKTTPLISALELRPLGNDTYITALSPLKHLFRRYLSNSTRYIRYPDDIYDLQWNPFFDPEWTWITTTVNVVTSDTYHIPQAAIETGATPTDASTPLTLSWTLDDPNAELYLYIHFAEIETLQANDTREFNIMLNENLYYGPYSPPKLEAEVIYSVRPAKCDRGECHLQLVKTPRSTLPPLLNAIEAFTAIGFPLSETNKIDVVAIKSIQTTYGLRRISWQGDPCVPKQYLWVGLKCSYADNTAPPRIIFLDLSSSGLAGTIAPDIQYLTQLEVLDLSNNNLIGGVPLFLANMKSLLVIDLSGNNLDGPIPQALLDRQKGGLKLNVEGNAELLCPSGSCKKQGGSGGNSMKVLAPVVASIASLTIIIAVLVFIFNIKKRKAKSMKATVNVQRFTGSERRFTYSEVLAMTNSFQKILGKGGFGIVYHGYVNDTEQVAVKMLSHSSAQGYKQFKAEVELLLRVHHKNLVSLVGYCDEGDNLALVYEYMANGDLKEHLSENGGSAILSWTSRLKIAVEAAQGLEYLHNGCRPPMVHRDVKTTNILLNEHFQAKLADFGLSRCFPVEDETHVSTVVAGTPGYLDPEYYQTNWLTEKSDVYSFGVVLLEIITNRPVIDKVRERPHITEWMGFMLTKGDIQSIVDPNLEGDYDSSSVWKAVELAMSCVSVNRSSASRPNMSRVVTELNECLATENSKSSSEPGMSFGTDVTPKAR